MTEALLNPPREDTLARQIIFTTQRSLQMLDDRLTLAVMDRETYLQTIGARKHLADLLKEQKRIYDKETTK